MDDMQPDASGGVASSVEGAVGAFPGLPGALPAPGAAEWELEQSDLIATLAHELRSPLTGMKGFVQAVLNRWDKLTDEQKKFMLSTALVDADRLSRLITEMLDVARLDTGRLQLHRRGVDPLPIVRRAVDGMVHSGQVDVNLIVDPALEAAEEFLIEADPDKFAQVVLNLIDNAVRHGGGSVDVRLSPDQHADDGDGLRGGLLLQVDDQGQGIPDQLRDRVFTKYWKGGASAGTGLGLYLVGGLVHAHGGGVQIGQSPYGGARLEVRWPLWSH